MSKGFPINVTPNQEVTKPATPTEAQRQTARERMARHGDSREAQVSITAGMSADLWHQLADVHARKCPGPHACGECSLIGEGVALAEALDNAGRSVAS